MTPSRLAGLRLLAGIAFCILAAVSTASSSVARYHVEVVDQPDQRRFVVTLRSSDTRPLCVYRDKWPNRLGQLHFGSTWVSLTSTGGTFAARDTNFGFCGGGPSCFLRIPPCSVLSGFIGYEQFGDPNRIAKLRKRQLRFPVSPFFCKQ